jgi:hypothetical protein
LSAQTGNIGGTSLSPFSTSGSGTDFTSPFTIFTSGSNLTGSLTNTTARPVLIHDMGVNFRSGSTGSVKLTLSTSVGGGNYSSSNFTGSGVKSYDPNLIAFVGTTVYAGFQKQNTTQVNWFRQATTTPQGGTAQSSGTFRDGTADSTFSGTSINSTVSWYTVPNAPGSLVAPSANITQNSVFLDWTPPTDNGGTSLTGYRVLYRPSGGSWSSTSSLGTSSQTTISGLSAGTTYEFRVAAINQVSDLHNGATDDATRSFVYQDTSAHTGTNATVFATTLASTPVEPDPLPVLSYPETGTWRVGQFSREIISATPVTQMSSSQSQDPALFGISVAVAISGDPRTVTFSGTPTRSGSFTYNVQAANGTSGVVNTGTQTISISPPFAPSWPATQFANGSNGDFYPTSSITAANSDLVEIVNNQQTVAGLNIVRNGATVSLSGTPNVATAGTYTFRAIAYSVPDNGVRTAGPEQTLSVTIAKLEQPAWTDVSIANTAKLGVPYSDSVSALNAVSYSVVSGSLPPGISLNTTNGAISGTPTAAGVYNFTVRASNQNLTATPDQALTLSVGLGRRYSTITGWQTPMTTAKRWNGSAWVNLSIAKRWDGSAWVDISN